MSLKSEKRIMTFTDTKAERIYYYQYLTTKKKKCYRTSFRQMENETRLKSGSIEKNGKNQNGDYICHI